MKSRTDISLRLPIGPIIGTFTLAVSAPALSVNVHLYIDDVNMSPNGHFSQPATTNDILRVPLLALIPITPGIHNIVVRVDENGGTQAVMRQNGSELIVVELPSWDQADDIL